MGGLPPHQNNERGGGGIIYLWLGVWEVQQLDPPMLFSCYQDLTKQMIFIIRLFCQSDNMWADSGESGRL